MLQLKFLNPLKNLNPQWFPVEYPNSWYDDITSDTERYMTLAAVQDDTIIGLVVTEVTNTLIYYLMEYGNFGEGPQILSFNISEARKQSFLNKTGRLKNIYYPQ